MRDDNRIDDVLRQVRDLMIGNEWGCSCSRGMTRIRRPGTIFDEVRADNCYTITIRINGGAVDRTEERWPEGTSMGIKEPKGFDNAVSR